MAQADDIETRDDIEWIVRTFYSTCFEDELLGPVFTDVAQMDLEDHMPIMCDFWETLLLDADKYSRNAFRPHVGLNRKLPLEARHFNRWIELWAATIDSRFEGPIAQFAKHRAWRMGSSMLTRLQMINT
jgi:hemoglobin